MASLTKLGEKLKALRDEADLTQEELGKQSTPSISGVYVSQIEKGYRTPNDEIIAGLARTLNYDPTELVLLAKLDSDEAIDKQDLKIDKSLYDETEKAIVFYRKIIKLPLDERIKIYDLLSRYNLEPPSKYIVKAEVDELYQHLNLTLPVDLVDVLKKLDDFIDFEERKLNYCIEGLCEKDKKNKIKIIINSSVNKLRKNWTIAHELGHALLPHEKTRSCRDEDLLPYFMERDPEKEANYFAAELLMREDSVKQDLKMKNTLDFEFLKRMSNRYKTSLASTAYRFISLSESPVMLIISGKSKKPKVVSSKLFKNHMQILTFNQFEKIDTSDKDTINSIGGRTVAFNKWFYSDADKHTFNLREESFKTEYGIMTLLSPIGDF